MKRIAWQFAMTTGVITLGLLSLQPSFAGEELTAPISPTSEGIPLLLMANQPKVEPETPKPEPEKQKPETPPPQSEAEYTESKVVSCPKLEEYAQLKKLANMVPNTKALPGKLPPDCASRFFANQPPATQPLQYTRGFAQETFQWTAPGLAHLPLYFEDTPLERYGQSRRPVVQPFVSAARFYAQIPMLPYKMSLDPPCQPICTLGYERPGNCVCPVRQRLPWDRRAAVVQGLSIAGAILLIP